MSVTFRVFFLDDEDHVHRIPLKRFERMILRHDSSEKFPEFADRRVRYALVAVRLIGGRPLSVERVDYAILQLDSEGRLDEKEWRRGTQLAVNMLPSYSGERDETVIDATRQFSKKRYDREFRWKPTREVEGALVGAIFGSKGELPKSPPPLRPA